MKRVKRTFSALLCLIVFCMLLTTATFAAETETAWLSVTNVPEDGGAAAVIVTNATVTDGVISLTYDSSILTYQDVVVNDAYIAQYAVNADTTGVVKISWIAPGPYEADASGACLIQVNFTGTASEDSLALFGSVHNADGDTIVLSQPDTTALEAAIAQAEALDADAYTSDSYAAVESALAEANAILADVSATQGEIDAATAALTEAIAGLVPVSSGDSGSGDNSNTGDTAVIGLAAMATVLCAAGILVLTTTKKRGHAE